MANSLNILSLNCNGLNNAIKARRIHNYIKSQKADIAFLLESHLKNDNNFLLKSAWFPQSFTASGSSKARGVVVLISKFNKFILSDKIVDPRGRFLILKGDLNERKVTLVAAYAPNTGQLSFVKEVLKIIEQFQEGSLIMGADLNYIIDTQMDRKRIHNTFKKTPTQQSSCTGLKKLLQKYNLIDSWRYNHPNEKDFTYFSHRYQSYSRIDYVLISSDIINNLIQADIDPKCWSDHAAVLCKLNLKLETDKTYNWKFDNFFLKNPEIVRQIEVETQEFFSFNTTADSRIDIIWDTYKAVLRGKLIAIASALKKKKMALKQQIMTTIKNLELEHKRTCNPRVYKSLETERKKLQALETQSISKNLFYAKQAYWNNSPKALRLLARKVKSKKMNSIIKGIRDENGHLMTSSQTISTVFTKFYSKLYQTKNPSPQTIDSFITAIKSTKTLSNIHRDFLDRPIDEEELLLAIKNMKTNKSPGVDGYTSEYYKRFSLLLSKPLLNLFNSILESSPIPESWNLAKIILLHKKDRDAEDPKSFRPISLLNNDYKLFTNILAKRLNQIIGNYIDRDQTGFISNRDMTDNIRKALNVIFYYKRNVELDSCMLSLDVEKAFDSVEHNYLLALLKHMNFGSKFIQVLHSIYSSSKFVLRINETTSTSHPMTRGTRQGCPLSPILFAIAVEPLANLLRGDPTFQGLTVNTQLAKVSLFADDILLFISNPKVSLAQIGKHLESFSQASGLTINRDKSLLYPINLKNDTKQYICTNFNFKWVVTSFRYLGVQIPLNMADLMRLNHITVTSHISSLLQHWMKLQLNLTERIQVVKSLILPKLTFFMRAIPIIIPLSLLKKWQRDLNTFIWNAKKPRINFTSIKNPKDRGGLAVPDLLLYHDSIILANLVKHYSPSYVADWKVMENSYLPTGSFNESLWNYKSYSKFRHLDNLFIQASFKIWDKYQHYLAPQRSLLTNFTGQKWFKPALHKNSFKVWKSLHMTRFIDITSQGHMKSKSQLEHSQDITIPWFEYFQVRRMVDSKMCNKLRLKLSDFEKMLNENSNSFKGLISKIYSLLLSQHNPNLLNYQKAWHRDLSQQLNDDQWNQIWCSSLNTSPCQNLQLQSYKLIARWYMTPVQLSHSLSLISPSCWKGCGNRGSFIHAWWLCPKVEGFWIQIIKEVNGISGCLLPLSPTLVLLNLWEGLSIPRYLRDLIATLFAAAKTVLASKWKKIAIPTLQEWLDKAWEYFIFDKILVELEYPNSEQRKSYFIKKWEPLVLKVLGHSNFSAISVLQKANINLLISS